MSIKDTEGLKFCNCARCGKEILGESCRDIYQALSNYHKRQLPRMMAGRIDGRPYCPWCFDIPKSPRGLRAFTAD